jgi:excisionase family DNA binding protein
MAVMINGRPYELISVVAKQYGIGRFTLYRATQTGKIPYVRIGRQRLIDLEAFEQFFTNQYRRKTGEAIKRAWARRKRLQAKAEGKVEEKAEVSTQAQSA